MTTNERASAQIFQFPARGRFAASVNRDEAKPAENLATLHVVSGGWYHEQAIQEAERARKN